MKTRILFLSAATLALGLAAARAQDESATAAPDVPMITTTEAQSYPQVTCTTSDASACADYLQLAGDTRDQLSSLLRLGANWRFPVHIHVLTPDDPLTAKINREASAVFAQGNVMKIEAVVPSDDPNAREFVQRQYLTALLWEKFFANAKTFDKHTRLDVVPLWLIEGMNQYLIDDPGHDREEIVRRAVQNKTAPTLSEITGWHELSQDRLLGLWQRAFSYYLFDSLTREGARRTDFQQWLAGFANSDSPTAQLHFPTEEDWQQELTQATSRSRDIVYTWDETQAELNADDTITYAASKDAKVQTCTLDSAATLPHTTIVAEALQERINVLTGLELRAHPSWHSILELYRAGLSALIADKTPSRGKQFLAEAQRQRAAESSTHQKVLDYVNWFEVTKDYSETSSPFRSYFDAAQQMERVQGDPAHPNPIRANLLQIESEL